MSTGQAATLPRAQARPRTRGDARNPLCELATSAPIPRTGLVHRPQLLRAVIGNPEAMLTLIVAPCGYGKSALLAEWAQADERPFVWVPLRHAQRRALTTAPGLRAQGRWDALAQLVRLTRDRHSSFVLVLDDAQLISPTALGRVLEMAMKDLPSGSTIAVASQTEPPLSVGRLRAHRLITEIRTPQLAMTPAEAAAVLRLAGVGADFEDVQRLMAQTEGWPAIVYLAALAAREDPDGLPCFSGEHHLVSDYLADEVHTSLPDDLFTFSVRTSVLDELSVPACDAVLGEPGSACTLAELARLSPLLIPVDPAHHTYRWHTLMREMLRGELRRREPELETTLCLHAAAWYTSVGDVEAAIGQTAAAGDPEQTGRLLLPNVHAYLTRGRSDLVREWLSRFTSDRLAEHAPLALSASLSALIAGEASSARHWSLKAASALERATSDGEDASLGQPLTAGIALIEAATTQDGLARMAKLAQDAVRAQSADSPWRPTCLFLAAVATHLKGDRPGAERMLDEVIGLSGSAEPAVTSLSLAQRSMLAVEQEQWDLAADLTDRAVGVIQEWELEDEPLSALAFSAAAASRAHQGRIDEAKHDVRRGVDLLATISDFAPWYGGEARVLLAHASLWLADVVGARALLAEASRFSRRISEAVVFSEWFDSAWAYLDTLAETKMAGPSSLTIAELRVLRFLPSHRSFREIAAQLGVSANTVKTQAHAVYRKLGAASRSEAIDRALEAGLLGQ